MLDGEPFGSDLLKLLPDAVKSSALTRVLLESPDDAVRILDDALLRALERPDLWN